MKALLLVLLFPVSAFAFDRAGLTIGGATREQQLALDVTRFWQISESRFFIGTGARFTSQWASGQTFRTAPSEITRGASGADGLFREEKKSNIDDLRLGSSQVSSLNVLVQLLFQWTDEWHLGANIDLIGFSWGKKRSGSYNPESDDASYPSEVSARPSSFNLLKGGDADRGSLNSEVYVLRSFGEHWGVKLGMAHAFSEYRTNRRLRKDNDRFRKMNLIPSLGLTRNF